MKVNLVAKVLLEEAAQLVDQGRFMAARRNIEKALAELRRRPQRLPAWVAAGAIIELFSDESFEKNLLLVVDRVDRGDRRRGWIVECSEVGRKDHVWSLSQERGRRFWRKYRGKQLSLPLSGKEAA